MELGAGPAREPAFDEQFVAEVDDDGRAILRFGDDEYGRALPEEAESLDAVYRVGNGRAGNVGPETIAHVAARRRAWIERVRNPLAADEGTDPETIEEVRQLAPQAFHTELFRAVTEADWAEAAKRLAGVAGAVATYRWTGSWTRSSSPSTRPTAPTSSTCRTAARGSSRASSSACARS